MRNGVAKQDINSCLPKLLQCIDAVETPAQKQCTNLYYIAKQLHTKMNSDIWD